ncbi:FISUMP domain-containing protein [Dysgonomonas sp. ZJ279]|uniref:FISUMP domain-containing protein n=1 Tax=Dysgonomonas sp. ZJ279 TaxID=2709796 RepID=UPI0013EA62C4|nr:FISUMP domain-containing protein [Dysgonomonas sp. ZJ279]
MNTFKIMYVSTFLILNISILDLSAQVTVGSNETPSRGSLLQLKNVDGVTDGSSNATKGLGAPRVALTNKYELYPMFIDAKTGLETVEYTNNKLSLKDNHIGLILYNVTEKNVLCTGVFVWNGIEWTSISGENKGFEIVTDKDGNSYPARTFNNAGTWMLENLRVKQYTTGISLTQGFVANASDKYYQYPDNNTGSTFQLHPEYGLLYSWAAATNGKTGTVDEGALDHAAVQGICPDGWKLPSNKDWQTLIDEVAANPTLYGSGTSTAVTDVAINMKSTTKVLTTATGGLSYPICHGAGLNILLTGHINVGVRYGFGSNISLWASSTKSATNGYFRRLYDTANHVFQGDFGISSGMAYIRCMKN